MKSIKDIAREVCMETGHPVDGRLQAAIETAIKMVRLRNVQSQPSEALTEDQCFIIESALNHGFDYVDDYASVLQCTNENLVSLVEGYRRAGTCCAGKNCGLPSRPAPADTAGDALDTSWGPL